MEEIQTQMATDRTPVWLLSSSNSPCDQTARRPKYIASGNSATYQKIKNKKEKIKWKKCIAHPRHIVLEAALGRLGRTDQSHESHQLCGLQRAVPRNLEKSGAV